MPTNNHLCGGTMSPGLTCDVKLCRTYIHGTNVELFLFLFLHGEKELQSK